jgi:hypothetical protein
MHFRFIAEKSIEEIGLKLSKTEGTLKDEELNETHFEITGLTGPKAVKLMHHMRSPVVEVRGKAIFDQIVLGLRDNQLQADSITGKDLLAKLGELYLQEIPGKKRTA